jgi:dTDP-4-dehydrorhamnose 3,5-epimerase
MFTLTSTAIPGLRLLRPTVRKDNRGAFVKTFHSEFFQHNDMEVDFKEQYYSSSKAGVIRGMHLQLPPFDHSKVVTCLNGEILDVVVDLRNGSPTFRQHVCMTLSSAEADLLYIPPGCAHGFLALTDNAMTSYSVSAVYSAAHDTGVLWNSFGLRWPVAAPILSDRDQSFSPVEAFHSPFVFR